MSMTASYVSRAAQSRCHSSITESAVTGLAPAWTTRLTVKVGDAEQHLRLKVDEGNDAVVGREQPFFAAFEPCVCGCHDFLLGLKMVMVSKPSRVSGRFESTGQSVPQPDSDLLFDYVPY